MSFNEGVHLDPERVTTSRGRRAAGIGGGSVLAIIAGLIIFQLTGIDVFSLSDSGNDQAVTEQSGIDLSHCRTGADADSYTDCRMVATAESLDAVWTDQLNAQGTSTSYVKPGFQIFQDAVDTGCGAATSDTGPFYCPTDSTVYLDMGFFDQLENQYGGSNAPLSEEYVVAHEFGHHIQNLLGTFRAHNSQQQGAGGDSVRMELQADCYAGIWMHWASSTADPDTGVTFLKTPTTDQIAEALKTAQAIGDDRIQEEAQGQTNSDSWTHGSSEQRQKWLTTGLNSGSIQQCDTFSASNL